jgi:hypothetical protein
MDHIYWLERQRASTANACMANGSQARLVHLDLAGRYSLKAAQSAPAQSVPAPSMPPEAIGLEELETGARWLASRSADAAERHRHLGMANRYARLGLEASALGRITAAPPSAIALT